MLGCSIRMVLCCSALTIFDVKAAQTGGVLSCEETGAGSIRNSGSTATAISAAGKAAIDADTDLTKPEPVLISAGHGTGRCCRGSSASGSLGAALDRRYATPCCDLYTLRKSA
jgi:hypothetical protein